MRYDEGRLSSVSPMAVIAVLPKDAAAELNAFYDTTVQSFCLSESEVCA